MLGKNGKNESWLYEIEAKDRIFILFYFCAGVSSKSPHTVYYTELKELRSTFE